MLTLTGLPTARGFAIGPAFVYRGEGALTIPEYRIEEPDVEEELARLNRARNETRRDLENLIAVLKERTGEAEVGIFESHLILLDDPMLVSDTEKLIREERFNAAAAVRRVSDLSKVKFGSMNDAYFRERVRDFEDVERRLLKCLLGFSGGAHLELKEPSIIVAEDLAPSEMVQLPRELVIGFAINGGSATSHVALLARSMGIPAVSGLGNVTDHAVAGETVLLDGTSGTVTIAPDRQSYLEFRELVEMQREISEELTIGCEAGTLKDGEKVAIYANLHPGAPLDDARKLGASGVGLYRSEYLWLNAEGEPDEEEQYADYMKVARFARSLSNDATVTIRALDIGGDKIVRGISQCADGFPTHEANPFLGNRSIRYLLSHLDVFRSQLRAILRASAGGGVKLMYPMISCVEELETAARVLAEAKAELDREGITYDRQLKVGAMIEVPAAALNASAIAEKVDFFSIGTNDLVQYTMAADRGNDAVANLYQPLNPAVISLVRMTIEAAKRRGIPVSVCGESAADPIVGALWVAMGIDTLSMSATYIPLVSKLFSRLTRADLEEYKKLVEGLGPERTAAEITEACTAWMRQRVPDLSTMMI